MTNIRFFGIIFRVNLKDSVYSEKIAYAFYKTLFVPALRSAFFKCVPSIFYHFFFYQHRASFLPGRIPVSQVDHPLDEKVPFLPSWIHIYIDFTAFWIRVISFFLRRYGRKAYTPVKEFILSMGELYAFAGIVYRKNLSTTIRPFYIANPSFFLIHLVDPHLMCIPSLHVMVVIHTYTMFMVMAKSLGQEDTLREQAQEMKQGALAISRAILFVKQHSVNCIAAALYAMNCYIPENFSQTDAEGFIDLLFSPDISANLRAPIVRISDADQTEIKNHILSLYRAFLREKEKASSWEDVLVNFLKTQPNAC
jgi:hypothetical protein